MPPFRNDYFDKGLWRIDCFLLFSNLVSCQSRAIRVKVGCVRFLFDKSDYVMKRNLGEPIFKPGFFADSLSPAKICFALNGAGPGGIIALQHCFHSLGTVSAHLVSSRSLSLHDFWFARYCHFAFLLYIHTVIMLAADKLQLQSALKQQATALKEKEFNLHHSNLSA